jgi:hypothetical protein
MKVRLQSFALFLFGGLILGVTFLLPADLPLLNTSFVPTWSVTLILFGLCATDFYVQSFRRGRPILKNPHLHPLIAGLLSVLIPVIWIALPYAYTHPSVMLTRVFLLLVAGVWWGRLLIPLSPWRIQLDQREQIGLLVTCAGLTLLAVVLFLGKMPPIHNLDDAMIMVVARNLFERGEFHDFLYPHRTPLDLAIGHSVLSWGLGRWMSIVGYSIDSARLYFLLVSVPCLPFAYGCGRLLYGKSVGWATTAITAPLLLVTTFTRPDPFMYVAFFAGLFFTGLGSVRKEWRWHIVAGLMIGFGYESHQYVVRFVFAIGIIHLIDYLRQIRQTKRFVVRHALIGFGIGLALYTIWFVIFHILIIGSTYNILETIQGMYRVQTLAGWAKGGEGSLLIENIRLYRTFFQWRTLSFILGIVGLGYALWRWKPADQLLLTLLIASAFSGGVILAHSTAYYWVYYVPFVALWGGRLIVEWGAGQITSLQTPAPLTRLTCTLIISLSFLLFADSVLMGLQPDIARTQIKVGKQIAEIIPSEAHITGDPIYHFGMSERRNYTAVDPLIRPKHVPLDQWAVVYTDPDQPFSIDYRAFALKNGLQEAYCYPLIGEYVTRVFIAPTSPFFPKFPQVCPPTQ